ncbi:head-tail connector protein [Yoonia sediminilitoris]|uniref:Putative phiE125 gp8 family phage protein n=1 Tax=Yoonia sediminilitoris TaxID=1286148 RepID=A0A2T6KDQ5_9RHOB|nr:hypothetical protein [Yoonia sediminilitoris]PUB13131.1 putative phiE125 gp8 family phage protein [Yoonia sediminilitoris]RCW94466.1 putative phiE125 gp8 family phage protein [Yoonia sediminilitoris]
MILVEETPVPQSALPVTQFKDHLRLGTGFANDGDENPVLESYLRAAMAAIEARTGKILIEREFSWTLSDWRDRERQPLPVAPVNAIVSMVLLDPRGEEALANDDAWVLQPDLQRPLLKPTSGLLPPIPSNGSVRIRLLAGFGPEWSDLPSDLGQAVLMLGAHFYDYRHDLTRGVPAMPYEVSALIERYRTVRLLMGSRS